MREAVYAGGAIVLRKFGALDKELLSGGIVSKQPRFSNSGLAPPVPMMCHLTPKVPGAFATKLLIPT